MMENPEDRFTVAEEAWLSFEAQRGASGIDVSNEDDYRTFRAGFDMGAKVERASIRRELLQEIGPVYVLRLPGTLLDVYAFKVTDTHAAINRILPEEG